MTGKRPEDFVCPVPMVWNDIYSNLCRIAEARGLDKPPVPLILNGWIMSSDLEKMIRWKQTKEWAERHGLGDRIPTLTEDQGHYLGD